MIRYLEDQLAAAAGGTLDGTFLLQEQPTNARRACLFCGMLELARAQRVNIEQTEPFGGILVGRVSQVSS
jgi:chromatin segregation and condensation protein Rec8/ScpA/Scc1 (kleisin family)